MMSFSSVVFETKLNVFSLRETAIFTLHSSTTAQLQGLQIFAQSAAKQPPISYAKMPPYSLTRGDVIAFELLLTTISSNLTEQWFVYLRNAFSCQNLIDKLTINVCKGLGHQLVLAKCWFVELLDKTGLNKICLISKKYYCYKQ